MLRFCPENLIFAEHERITVEQDYLQNLAPMLFTRMRYVNKNLWLIYRVAQGSGRFLCGEKEQAISGRKYGTLNNASWWIRFA